MRLHSCTLSRVSKNMIQFVNQRCHGGIQQRKVDAYILTEVQVAYDSICITDHACCKGWCVYLWINNYHIYWTIHFWVLTSHLFSRDEFLHQLPRIKSVLSLPNNYRLIDLSTHDTEEWVLIYYIAHRSTWILSSPKLRWNRTKKIPFSGILSRPLKEDGHNCKNIDSGHITFKARYSFDQTF